MVNRMPLNPRITVESPISWSFYSQRSETGQATRPQTAHLVNLGEREALIEASSQIPLGRWIRLRLRIDSSFELLMIGRIALTAAGPALGTHYYQADLTQAINPVVLSHLRLRQKFAELRRKQSEESRNPLTSA